MQGTYEPAQLSRRGNPTVNIACWEKRSAAKLMSQDAGAGLDGKVKAKLLESQYPEAQASAYGKIR